MTKLTTHVLDIYSGKPGKGIKVELYFISAESRKKIKSIILFQGKNGKRMLDDALIKWQFEYKKKKSLTSEDSFILKISNLRKKK